MARESLEGIIRSTYLVSGARLIFAELDIR